MGIFGKSANEKALEAENERLESQVADLTKALRTELATNDALDRTARKYREERDAYKPDALKFRALKSNLIPGGPYRGKGSKAANGASPTL